MQGKVSCSNSKLWADDSGIILNTSSSLRGNDGQQVPQAGGDQGLLIKVIYLINAHTSELPGKRRENCHHRKYRVSEILSKNCFIHAPPPA